MLRVSIGLLFIANLYFNNLKYIAILSVAILLFNAIFNKKFYPKFFKNIKRLYLFFIFYFLSFGIQILFNQDGNVIFKVWKIYVTQEGVNNFLVNFVRVINIFILSYSIDYKKIIGSRFEKYQRVIENVVMLVPEVMTLFKRRTKIKWFFRHILKQIMVKI